MRAFTLVGTLGAAIALTSISACSNGTKAASAAGSASLPASAASTPATAASPSTSAAAGGGSNACSLLSVAQATTLVPGHTFTAAVPTTPSTGIEECAYGTSDDGQAMTVTVYQSGSGVSFAMLKTVNASVGAVTSVPGVGDQAVLGTIELDVQAGQHLMAIQGGFVTQGSAAPVAVAKAILAALG
jgi:hypothetical protein